VTRYVILTSIVLCTSALTYGLISNGLIVQGVIIAVLGVAWLALYLRNITLSANLAFILFGLISAGVVWAGVSHWLALAGMVFALLAWDLTAFEKRLKGILNHSDVQRMERAHIARLALIIGLGVAGVFAAGVLKVDLTLGSALILAVLGIWGISALVYRLRSRE
jgi:hypothetical protein